MVLWLMASPTVPFLSVLVQPNAGTNAPKFWRFSVFLALEAGGASLILRETRTLKNVKFPTYRDVNFWRVQRYHLFKFW